MATVTHKKKTIVVRRIRWDNILYLAIGLMITICMWIMLKVSVLAPYEIEYVEYTAQNQDTIYNLVQEMNDYTPFGWDTRDFVALALDKNNLTQGEELRVGDKILIPVAIEK